ncbi:MAG: putative quinol monooxygenase [Pseudomonadota bacterium]|nr:putative quinol monooxygenase [Pseudomonadota bacterium]
MGKADKGTFAVSVEFLVRPENAAVFRPLMLAQAENSLKLETGCRYFDVCIDNSRAGRFVLYEVYDDEAAFEVHLKSAHFLAFAKAVEPMVLSRRIERLDVLGGSAYGA